MWFWTQLFCGFLCSYKIWLCAKYQSHHIILMGRTTITLKFYGFEFIFFFFLFLNWRVNSNRDSNCEWVTLEFRSWLSKIEWLSQSLPANNSHHKYAFRTISIVFRIKNKRLKILMIGPEPRFGFHCRRHHHHHESLISIIMGLGPYEFW